MGYFVAVKVWRHGNGEQLIPVTDCDGVYIKDQESAAPMSHQGEGLYSTQNWPSEYNIPLTFPCRVEAAHLTYGGGSVIFEDPLNDEEGDQFYEIILESEEQDPPTFNNQTLAAKTCAPTSATASSAIQCNAFTAATAAAGGSITYTIVKVVEQGTTTSLSGWTIVSSTRIITIPANTPGGKTYEITVRATESTTGLYSDAVITQVLNKRSPTMTISPTSSTIKYPNSTTFTITAGNYYGTLSVTSNYPTRAQASISGTTITVSTASSTATGAARISVTSAATDYDNAVTKAHTATVQVGDGTPPLFANSTVEVTLAATNATTSPYRGCPNFTAAGATHGGSIAYQIVSVEDENGNAQTVGTSAWCLNGSVAFTTTRIIRVPAQTPKGVYYVVINARESAAGMYGISYKEATITVNVLGTPQNAPSALGELAEYATSGTVTGSASGGGGIGTLYYESDVNGGTSYGSATTTAPSRSKTSVGTTTFIAYWSGNDYWAQSPDSNQASLVITKRTGAAPTFNNQSKSVTLAATSATVSPIVNVGTFTAATAGHSGSITYQIISVTNQTNTGQNITGWTLGGNTGQTTSRQIRVPAQTPGAQVFAVVVRATEGETTTDTSSYKDATITVTVSKRTPTTMSLSPTTMTLKIPASGTITVTRGDAYGTLSVASNQPTRAAATISGTTVTVSTSSSTNVGTASINVTSAATDYDNAKTVSCSVTVQQGDGAAPTFGNSSVSATLTPTAATTSPAVNCGTFTTATAGHGGSITYSIVSVDGGSVGSWSMTSTTSRVIKVPENTAGGTSYAVVVRATEAATNAYSSSYKDATITVSVIKATVTLTLTGNPSNCTSTYDNGGTITASGTYHGTISASSGTTSVATVSTSGSVVTVTCVKAGSSVITVTSAATDYENSATATKTWTINKATGYLTATTTNRTYTGSEQVIAAISTNSGAYYFGLGSSTTVAPTSWGSQNQSLKATTVGTYYVWAKCNTSTNYLAVDAKYIGTVTISQRTVTPTAPTATNRTYNRSAQTIFAAGSSTTGGTMYYSETNKTFSTSTWSTTLPYTQKTNAGTYTMYWYCYVSDTTNNTGTNINTIKSVSATISKVTPVVSTNPTKVSNWTYDKTAHNLLSGGAYKHSSSDSTAVAGSFAYAQATNAGSYTSLTWTFTPTDTTNYNTATGSITGTVTVSPKGVTTQWGVLTWTYDGSAHSTTCGLVSGGVISGDACNISLSGNSVGPNVGTATVTATLSNSNYTISSGGSSQTLTITQATPTLTFTYNPSATTTYSAAGPKVLITASVAGTVYWGTTSASSGMTNTKAVSAGTATQLTQNTTPGTTIKVYAYFVPTDITNYKNVGSSTSAGATSSNVTYNKATGGVTISNANPTYGTSNNLATVSGATGTMYYRVGTSGNFSTTIPTASGRNAGSYTLYYYVAESTNYTAFGTSSSPKSLTVTVAKASNQITVSPTSVTVYYRTGYTNATVTVSNYKGTVTAESSNTGKITVSPASSTSGTFTVSGVAAGSATITFTDTSTNYDTSTATCSVTCAQDSVSSVDVSVGTKSLSYGGTTSITATAHYASGYSPNVTSSATYTSSPTNKVEVKPGATVAGIYIDDLPSYDYIHDESGGEGIRTFTTYLDLDEENYYTYVGTITYGGQTRYLWQNSNAAMMSYKAYIVTASNDPATLIAQSVQYNMNNWYTNSIIAILKSDQSTVYNTPTASEGKRITMVVMS